MINYLLQVLFFQLLFLAVYDVFFKKETFFQWNRFYLITSSIIAYGMPFIKIRSLRNYVQQTYKLPEIIVNPQTIFLNQVTHNSLNRSVNSTIFTLENLYFLGLIFMFILFLFKLFQLLSKIQSHTIIKKPTYKLVVLNNTDAFSFFNYIFLGKKLLDKEHQHILKHELTHVKQKHSLDLLFFEIQKIVFWFNPFSYLFQNRIAALHEFIADTKTIAIKDTSNFFENLLLQSFNIEKITFVSNYYKKSLIKKRILMATKNKSQQILKTKYLAVLPIIIAMLIITSCTNRNEDLKTTNNKIISLEEMEEMEEIIPMSQIDKVPMFPNCESLKTNEEKSKCLNENIKKHIIKNFNMDLANNLELSPGKKRISVQFVINKEGLIKGIKSRAPHPKLQEEAIRVIKLLPQMHAGEKNGKAVNVRYNLPITFKIEN